MGYQHRSVVFECPACEQSLHLSGDAPSSVVSTVKCACRTLLHLNISDWPDVPRSPHIVNAG
jgi:hypothetical protein